MKPITSFSLFIVLLLNVINYAVAENVTFTYTSSSSAKTVDVAGTFNSWNQTANPLQLQSDHKTWSTSISLKPGVYQFKFVVDGIWYTAPGYPTIDDGNGDTNSVLYVFPSNYSKYPGKLGDGIITPSAVLSEPNAPWVTRYTRNQFELTIRTRANDVEKVSLLIPKHSDIEMTLQNRTPVYDTWIARAEVPSTSTMKYAFLLNDGSNPQYYDLSGMHAAIGSPDWFTIDIKSFPPFITPHWAENAIFYQIFPDSYGNGIKSADSSGKSLYAPLNVNASWHGGNLPGVMLHWAYLKKLGINALYFNPVFTARSNHGYDTTDYMHVDPHFGTNQDLKALVHKAHRDGWHVILDGVFNHTGIDFFAFHSLLVDGAKSPYKNWYYIRHFPLHVRNGEKGYRAWFGTPWLPKLNVDNPATRAYLLHVATWWIDYAHIDGWRLDAADQVDPDYWKVFRTTVLKSDPNAYLLGEIWVNASFWLQGDMFDAVMNYPWRQIVLDFFAHHYTSPTVFASRLRQLRNDYPPAATREMFNLLDSHDTERVRTTFGGNWDSEKLAVLFQMSYPGTPCIYYGDEIGMEGGDPIAARHPMIWNPAKQNHTILNFYRAVIALRKHEPALRQGSFKTVVADDSTGAYGFLRTLKSKRILVLFNRSNAAIQLTVPADANDLLNPLLEGSAIPVKTANGEEITLPPLGYAVLD